METIWFIILSVMVAGYVVFDGFDLGVGVVHLYAARTDAERRRVLASIGPVWDGNEVWLLASGGILFLAFPTVYASSFSGFYLPLMIVLWLLILRAIAIEFRNHLESPIWQPVWDVVFAGASGLLTIFFGAALGNVVRGVPLDGDGVFFLPLWTDWTPGASPGILDWYTVLVGLTAFVTLTAHGALWVALKTDDAVRERSRRMFGWAWTALVPLLALMTWATFSVQPHVPGRLFSNPAGLALPAIAVVALVAMRWFDGRGREFEAFLASCGFIVFLLLSAVFGLYPFLLPSNIDPAMGLSVENAATAPGALRMALYWFVPGFALIVTYFWYIYSRLAGKVPADVAGH